MTSKVLLPMEMHNVFRECDAGTEHLDRNTQCFIMPFMGILIEQLSLKRPTWHFHATSQGSFTTSMGKYRMSKFMIVEHGEALGIINWDWHGRNGDCYSLDNPRLKVKRHRGANTKTNNVSRAVKIVLEHYYARTLTERMADATKITQSHISSAHSSAYYDVRNGSDYLRSEMIEFLLANWEEFNKIPMSQNNSKRRDDLPAKVALSKELEPVYNAYQSGKGSTAVTRGDSYHVARNGSELVTYTSADVPPRLKMGIAMLKLVDVRQHIAGVGMRTEDNTFFVMDEPDEQLP